MVVLTGGWGNELIYLRLFIAKHLVVLMLILRIDKS